MVVAVIIIIAGVLLSNNSLVWPENAGVILGLLLLVVFFKIILY